MSQVSDKYINETGMRPVDFEGRYFPSYVTWLEKRVEGVRERAPNSSSPKLPEFTKVYDAVKEWFDSAPDFARPCPADIVKVAYDFIAGNFGH